MYLLTVPWARPRLAAVARWESPTLWCRRKTSRMWRIDSLSVGILVLGWEAKAKITVDRKSTRLNSSHLVISYAVFCLKKKKHNRSRAGASQQLLASNGDSAEPVEPPRT